METVIRSLNRYAILNFHDIVPEYVIQAGRREGYFALGIVGKTGDEESLVGMTVFFVSSTGNHRPYAEIVYVYVIEEFRRQGLGKQLLNAMEGVLKKSGQKFSLALLPDPESEEFQYATEAEELQQFFVSCGYEETVEDQYKRLSILDQFYPPEEIMTAHRFLKPVER